MTAIPSEVFFAHIFPHLETEKDALNGYITFIAPIEKNDVGKELRHHWLQNPYCTLLEKTIERGDLQRCWRYIALYPWLVYAHDGRILRILLGLYVDKTRGSFAPKSTYLMLFDHCTSIMMKDNRLDFIQQNVEHFMDALLFAIEDVDDQHIIDTLNIFPLMFSLFNTPWTHVHYWTGFSHLPFWHTLLGYLKNPQDVPHTHAMNIMKSIFRTHAYVESEIPMLWQLLDDLLSFHYTSSPSLVVIAFLVSERLISWFRHLPEKRLEIKKIVTKGIVRAVEKGFYKMVEYMAIYFNDTNALIDVPVTLDI